MKRAATFLFTAAIAAAAAQASAASRITEVHFHGEGVVTYATTEGPDNLLPPGLAIGDPVHVTGAIWLDLDDDPEFGSGVPANFTGSINFTQGLFEHATAFVYDVEGAYAGASSYNSEPYKGGSATFLDGRLTGLSMYAADEVGANSLWTDRFESQTGNLDFTDSVATWGGEWTLHVPTPEPAAWALMLLGFGAVGGAMRRRRAAVARGA